MTWTIALAGAVVIPLEAQSPAAYIFPDTRYLLEQAPPGVRRPPPPSDPGYRETPRQFPLPAAQFVVEDGVAVSSNSVFQVRLAPSLGGVNSVHIRTPEGKSLRGVPVALSLMDPRTGTNVLIAEIKPGHQRLVESNRVAYVDCWDDVRADVVYVLSRSRIAQHVVIRGPLPDVAKLGMDPKTARLQVWTEMAPSEEPARQTTLLKRVESGLDFVDDRVGMGLAEMVPGRAFLVGGNGQEINRATSPVGKRYMKYGQPGVAGERAFLVEEVECEPLFEELSKSLPQLEAEPVRREGAMQEQPAALPPAQPKLIAQGTQPAFAYPTRPSNGFQASLRSASAASLASQVAVLVDWELLYGGDTDQDSDGLPDTWEYLWFGSLTAQGPLGDPDNDGLNNWGELFAGTNPRDTDTDRDGTNDTNDVMRVISSAMSATVWFNEPTNVYTNAVIGSWIWVGPSTNPPYPAYGLANFIPPHDGDAWTGFTNHPTPLTLSSNDVLFSFIYLPPYNPPTQIALHWLPNDGTGWRGAYWGDNNMGYTNAVQISSNLPLRGQWVMVAAQAGQMGLGGKTIVGMRLMAYDGPALWDYSGLWLNGYLDYDSDGVANWRETQLGTDPYYPDSDYDGRSDGQEMAEGTDPMNPASALPVRLGYWKFNTTNFVGESNQVPTFIHQTVGIAPSWSSNAMVTASNIYSGVRYREYETNGMANINCRNGTVRLWFKPNWSSTNMGGTGPNTHSRFIELGYYTDWPNWVGHWAFGLNPSGTILWFQSWDTATTNWSTTKYTAYGVPISWVSNQWHQIVVTYTPTNSAIYIDGQLAGSGGGITNYPKASLRAQYGLKVGFDHYGAWANGHFEELETFNYPLSASTILSNYQSVATRDTDGDGVTDLVELALGRNPWVGNSASDTNNQTGMLIFTPLK